MNKQRNYVAILVGLVIIACIFIFALLDDTPAAPPLHWWLFTILLTYTSTYGIPLPVGELSLASMVTMISLLVLGIFPTTAAVVISDVIYGLYRWAFPKQAGWEKSEDGYNLVATTSANLTMHSLSVIAAGLIYYGLGGSLPVGNPRDFAILVFSSTAYILTNYLLASLFLWMRSRPHVKYLLDHIGSMLLYEAIPLIFAPLAASIWIKLGVLPFLVFALSMVIASVILKNQAVNKLELKRHIKELEGLQSMGRTLSAILDEDQIAEAIYREVCKLMPTDNFYMALYLPGTDMIHFPIHYEHNIALPPRSRKFSNALTEYIIQTKQPLLIEKNVKQYVENLGITHYGEEALSWLGVPMIAGEQVLGMIAVQSYPATNKIPAKLNIFHQEILSLIAAQGAIALQNARLYTQTDQALTQRVRELNSILNNTSEGIALLNDSDILLEINQSLCQMLECFKNRLVGESVHNNSLLANLRISQELKDKIISAELAAFQDEVSFSGDTEMPAERTISPVMGREGKINGWLLVFRDTTKEHQLAEFREDLAHMLVHDLRSPVVSIQGGLDMIEVLIDDEDKTSLMEMLDISRKGSSQILGMINELLHLNHLESGKMILKPEPVDLETLFKQEIIFLRPGIQQAKITVEEDFGRDLPIIQADSGLLKRVIHNLLDNAIKFTPDFGVLRLWAKLDPDNEELVLFGVQDNGPGIPEDQLPDLFTKYFCLEGKQTRRRGTGLGLHYARLAVAAHDGEIWAESKLDTGTNFVIRMPVNPDISQ